MPHDQTAAIPQHWKRRTIVSAIAAALAPGWNSVSYAQDESDSDRLEEVIVTARKRDENIQDIPQSIQAFSQADMTRVGIRGLDDVAKFVPAMTVVGSTAGLNKIVFRGLADSARPFIADSSAAIYLDEQPLTTGAQSPEIRPIDLERIETLAGPQGTLYGASSQSGTVRYIVAKPDVSAFDANVGGGLHTIDGGDTGWDGDAMINIPIIPDKFAIRLVGFSARDAGYIDNVLSNTPGRIDAETGERIIGGKTNADVIGKDLNDAEWYGGRISAKWQVNDKWALTGIFNYTNLEIGGFNDMDPTRGDLKTTKFKRESWDDEWGNFQFTIDGDLGFAQLTSSSSYFERDTAYVFDATSGVAYYHSVLGVYGRGTCGSNPYYAAYNTYDFATACELNGTGYDVDDGDPTGFWRNDQKDKRFSHETRLSGSTSRWDWTLGFFYQEADQHWNFVTQVDDLTRTEAWAAFTTQFGALEPTNFRWNSGETSERRDIAVFGETTFSLTDKWKVLLGARWYDVEIDRVATVRVPATAPADITTPSGSNDGVLPKYGLQYFFAEDRMLYALYSEGFRAGGANRARGTPTLPIQFKEDTLENIEAGLKSRWLDGRLQVNIIGYLQSWKDMQLELVDPSFQFGEPFQTVIANVGDASVDGVDFEVELLPAEGWSLGLVGTHLFTAEIDDDIAIFDERAPENLALEIAGGTRLPLVGDTNISSYAEYHWKMDLFGGSDAWLRLQYNYTDSSFNRLVDNDANPEGDGVGGRVRQPSYEIWDLRAGISGANWEVGLYVDNLDDERYVSFRDTNADVFWGRDNIRIGQPRTYGTSFRYFFR